MNLKKIRTMAVLFAVIAAASISGCSGKKTRSAVENIASETTISPKKHQHLSGRSLTDQSWKNSETLKLFGISRNKRFDV